MRPPKEHQQEGAAVVRPTASLSSAQGSAALATQEIDREVATTGAARMEGVDTPPDVDERMAAALRGLIAAQRRRQAATAAEERHSRYLLQTMQYRGLSLFWNLDAAAEAQLSRAPVFWYDFGRVPERWWGWARQVPGLLSIDSTVLDALAPSHEGVRSFRQSMVAGHGSARLIVEVWPAKPAERQG